jgi:alpha-tubulin suppressor-like RCC1 family protein
MPFIKQVAIFVRKAAPKIESDFSPNVDSGINHNGIIKTTGRIFMWGGNGFGQLGDNSTTQRSTPVSVAGAVKTFCKISLGGAISLAIDKNGKIWSWGYQQLGELGINVSGTTSSRTPVSVITTKTFCHIGVSNNSGANRSIAIDKDGNVWGWGSNSQGQIGDGTTTSRLIPVQVTSGKTFCKIASGIAYSLAIDKNGRAWSWGSGGNGSLGDNTVSNRCIPVSVAGATKTFCQIECSSWSSYAIDKNGRAWAWGLNGFGQLGDNSITRRNTPVSVAGAVKTFCQISGGDCHTVAIDKNGRAWAWGLNDRGQLGDNTTVSKRTPVSVAGATKTFCDISAGSFNTFAVDKDGNTWGWGENSSNGVGVPLPVSFIRTPVSVLGTTKTFCKIVGGNCHTVAIDKNGRAWAWGSNLFRQIGSNMTDSIISTPVSIAGATKTFCTIEGGQCHTAAIDKNGRAWSWGGNSFGQLGDNSGFIRNTPVSVAGAIKTFCQIATGNDYTIAIDKSGQVWSWGLNSSGQLGDNTTVSKRTPVSVAGATKTFCQISGGGSHTVAIDNNSRAWAWGSGASGVLGNNSQLQRNTPVSVLGAPKTFYKINAGLFNSAAIDNAGRLWTWGSNNGGQLGINSTDNKLTPVSVCGTTKTFCQIAIGSAHMAAIDKNGQAWAWGLNSNGQLGDNTTVSKRTPVSVVGATKTFCQIATGNDHTIAIDKNGKSWGWGLRNVGQLADGYTTFILTPVRVCNL